MTDLSKIPVKKLSVKVLFDIKNRSSFCWNYFGCLVKEEDGKRKKLSEDHFYCSVCLQNAKIESEDVTFGLVKVKAYNKTVSTGNLIRHLWDYHQIREEETNVDTEDLVKEFFAPKPRKSQVKTKEVPKKQLPRELALWYCRSLIPFDSVFDDAMRDFFKKYKIIANDDDIPTRDVISRTALDNLYDSILSSVKEQIVLDAAQYLAIALDSWTQQHRRLNYITFRLHYLTSEFEKKYFTLTTQMVRENINEDVQKLLTSIKKQFKLCERKIHSVTVAGTNIKCAVDVSNHEHNICLGNGLHNLVTVDGIKTIREIKELINKCKMIINAVGYRLTELLKEADKKSTEFLNSLEQVTETLESDENNPIPDLNSTNDKEESSIRLTIETAIPTRWHCLLEILEIILRLGNVPLNRMLSKIEKEDLKIHEIEWNLLEGLVEFLRKFRVPVEVVSSQKTCTMNVALIFRSEIKDILQINPEDETLIMNLKQNMLASVDKRFPLTKAMIVAALLDYRFVGLKEIDVYLSDNCIKDRVSLLSAYIREVIGFDASQIDSVTEDTLAIASPSSASSDIASTSTLSLLEKLSQKHRASSSYQDVKNDPLDQECWRYLSSVNPCEPKDGDLLAFWNKKKHVYPRLSALAQAVLCVPVTSTPNDVVFSEAGLIVSQKKSRICPMKVNKMIFIHDNYPFCNLNA